MGLMIVIPKTNDKIIVKRTRDSLFLWYTAYDMIVAIPLIILEKQIS